MSEKRSLMEELYGNTLKDIKEGEVVKGRVIGVTAKEAVVDIGFKSEGFVSREEFRDDDDLKVGNEIEVLVEKIGRASCRERVCQYV